jgi:hypothetical protein
MLQGTLQPDRSQDSRFGFAMAALPDLNHDGFTDVAVGAPLEDEFPPALQNHAAYLGESQRVAGNWESRGDPARGYEALPLSSCTLSLSSLNLFRPRLMPSGNPPL